MKGVSIQLDIREVFKLIDQFRIHHKDELAAFESEVEDFGSDICSLAFRSVPDAVGKKIANVIVCTALFSYMKGYESAREKCETGENIKPWIMS